MASCGSLARLCHHAVMLTVALCITQLAFGQQPFTEGTQVTVTTSALRLRAAPSLSADSMGTFPRGSLATVVDPSPFWADGYWWWQIAYPDGARGWSAEGDAQERYLEAVPPRAGRDDVGQPQAVRSSEVPVQARTLFESLFWNGSLVLGCAEQPQFVAFEGFSELRLERSCTSPTLSGTYTSDLGSMASVAEGEWLLTVDVVDVVDTHLGRLYLVEYVDDIAYGVAGAVMYHLYLDAGSGPELVLRVASREYALRLVSAGPVALLQNWSGSAAFELASDRFVRRHGSVEAAPPRFPSESESQAHFTRLRRTAHERGAVAARALAPQELAAVGISSSTIAQLDDVIDALQAIAAEPYVSDAVRAERLRVVQRSWDAELVAIAVRLVPVYDPSSGEIQSFDAFARELTRDLGTGSPFAADPVGTTVDLLFNPSVENVSRFLGFGF
jgi:hypothetical protein